MNEGQPHYEAQGEVIKPVEQDDSNMLSALHEMTKSGDFSLAYELLPKRLAYLESQTAPDSLRIMETEIYNGYINSKSDVNMSSYGMPFKPDDEEIYKLGIEKMENVKRQVPSYSDALSLAVASLPYIMSSYFGNTADVRGSMLDGNLEVVGKENEDSSIKRFAGRKNSVCIHQATVAQQLLSFCGINTTIVLGSLKAGEEKSSSGHAYNIISGKNYNYILDVHNPVFVLEGDQVSAYLRPSVYSISAEEKERILEGGGVEVEHGDEIRENGEAVGTKMSRRTYSGPEKTGYEIIPWKD